MSKETVVLHDHADWKLLAQDVPLTPTLLRLDPMFDPLHNDPRFQKRREEKTK